jgi:DNA-directed RNA polymerase specialized sigma24 family protein
MKPHVRWKDRKRGGSKPKIQAPEVAEDDLNLALIGMRSYTRTMIRRYVLARYQAARIFSCLDASKFSGSGRASARPIRTFEDALVFVIDMDRCMESLSPTDLELLKRTHIQEFTEAETACLMGMSTRTVSTKAKVALDRLTQRLIDSGLLIVPDFLKAA